ncbi:MAG: hypothetical protein H0T72_12740 [Chloroflexia bacterium]|nr:hypothetical protein [Chloroflexia bacterium]
MSKYTLWDIPSSSLLLESQDLDVVAESAALFVSDNGKGALANLLLGIEPDGASPVQDLTGMHILEAIKREQGALKLT